MAELGILDIVVRPLLFAGSTVLRGARFHARAQILGLDAPTRAVKGKAQMPATPVTIIVLAGQRAGVVNALAARAGVSHKCLAPIRGKPLIAHVLDTVTALTGVREVRISVEPEVHGEVAALASGYLGRGVPIRLVLRQRKNPYADED